MKTRLISILSSAAALLAMACGASAPSKELMTARNAYAQARNSEAAQLNPAGVHDAYKALQAAEIAHADDAGSTREKHYAYLAARKSETAIAAASGTLAKEEQQRATQSYEQMLKQQSAQASAQRDQSTEALQQSQRELDATRQAAEQAQEQLRQEQALREEAGRTIIGLTGVLFKSGGHELSPSAERRLDTVASALGMYADREISIEGFTDSSGSEELNQELSQKRAEAVRTYLSQRGISSERMHAVGHGEESPIAPNDTAEGRAVNRRVEIVVQPPTTGSTTGSRNTPPQPSQQTTTPQGVPVPGPTLPAGPSQSDDEVDDDMQ
jgi:outer membrane protein OmpA-like peptidoglycan-associated protein